MYQGTQFNAAIVKIVLDTNLLEEHASSLAENRGRMLPTTKLDDWKEVGAQPVDPANAETR